MKNNQIKSLPIEERPREKAAIKGVQALSNAELLAIVFNSGSHRCSVLEISRSLLLQFTNFRNLSRATIRELQKTPGIGVAKATQLKACLEIAKRFEESKILPGQTLSGSKQVYQHFNYYFRDEKKEKFFTILLDSKNQIIKEELISIGSLNTSIVHPREVFSLAIKESANAILLIHNHPSGDPTPSLEDIQVTKRLIDVGNLVGIKVLDHIVIGNDCYISFAEESLVTFKQ